MQCNWGACATQIEEFAFSIPVALNTPQAHTVLRIKQKTLSKERFFGLFYILAHGLKAWAEKQA